MLLKLILLRTVDVLKSFYIESSLRIIFIDFMRLDARLYSFWWVLCVRFCAVGRVLSYKKHKDDEVYQDEVG